MTLDVSRSLINPGQAYSYHGVQAIAPVEVGGDEVTFDEVTVEGTYMADDAGNITVDGSLVTVAHAPCANCLEPASAQVSSDYRETFLRGGDPEDDEIFAYNGHEITLDKLIMSYAVLAMPMRFLCREDCPGLPYMRGEDHETENTGKADHVNYPFAGLKQLLEKKEED